MLWMLICLGASWDPVLYGRMNAFCPTDAPYTFVAYMNALVTFQIVSDPSIPFLRMCFVDLDDFFCKQAIFYLPLTELAAFPFVIGIAATQTISDRKIDGINRILRQDLIA